MRGSFDFGGERGRCYETFGPGTTEMERDTKSGVWIGWGCVDDKAELKNGKKAAQSLAFSRVAYTFTAHVPSSFKWSHKDIKGRTSSQVVSRCVEVAGGDAVESLTQLGVIDLSIVDRT